MCQRTALGLGTLGASRALVGAANLLPVLGVDCGCNQVQEVHSGEFRLVATGRTLLIATTARRDGSM